MWMSPAFFYLKTGLGSLGCRLTKNLATKAWYAKKLGVIIFTLVFMLSCLPGDNFDFGVIGCRIISV